MRKSKSTPNLHTFNALTKPQTILIKNISVNALPILDITLDPFIPKIIENVTNEIQLESVLHVTTSQATSCILANKEFPKDILDNVNNSTTIINKNIAECLLEPDYPEEKEISVRRSISSYLDLCELCNETSERYALYFRKVRQLRKKNIQNI